MGRVIKNIRWIKWATKETLYGSFMTEPPESLGFMLKLCCFSAESRYPGYVQSEFQKGIPHPQLASILNIPLEDFEDFFEVQILAKRIIENGNGVIEIVNWEKYQTIAKWNGDPSKEPPKDEKAINKSSSETGSNRRW